MKILLTGSTGFLGRKLLAHLEAQGNELVCAVRRAHSSNEVAVGNIGPETDWHQALTPHPSNGMRREPVDAVVHLAARVHVMRDGSVDPLAAFREVNTAGTLTLARQAAQAGVRRIVFMSSVKVNGEGRQTPYTENDPARPQDPYAVSKWEAEQGLREISRETGMEVVIIRPPLVYGPGVGANFLRLMHLVDRGIPLPLGAVANRRSLIYLGNLVDAVSLCLTHPAAANRTWLVSDGEDVSTPGLIRMMAAHRGRRTHLFPVPPAMLKLAGKLVGKEAEMRRLLGSLTVDSGRIRHELSWSPPYSLDKGLAETCMSYQTGHHQ